MKRNSRFEVLQRATFFVALFFGVTAWSAPAETYKDIIEKAYNLSLQKDRGQAMTILINALKKESKKSTAQKELASALEQVSKVFYSDKTQQLYELGLSLKSTDPGTALNKLQEASRLEPDNLSIEIAIGRQILSNGDCSAAAARVSKLQSMAQAVEELRLLAAQAAVCLGKFDDYLAARNGLDLKQSQLATFWQAIEIEYLIKTASFAKAQDLAETLQKSDPTFPESVYWKWKAETETKQRAEKSATRYLSQCKTMNGRLSRQYLPEPNLCRRTAEVETFLKKSNNTEL